MHVLPHKMNATQPIVEGTRYTVTIGKRNGQFGLRLRFGDDGVVTVLGSRHAIIPDGCRIVAVEGCKLSEMILMRTFLMEVFETQERVTLTLDKALNCRQL